MSLADDFGGMVPKGGWLPSRKNPARTTPVFGADAPGRIVQSVAGSYRTVTPDVDISAWEPDIDAPGGGVHLIELRRDTCRFPLRGATGHAMRFCGQPTEPGESWCQRCRGYALATATPTPPTLRDASTYPGGAS